MRHKSRIHALNKALSMYFNDSVFLKESSLKRTMNIDSFCKKLIGLVFPKISEELKLLKKNKTIGYLVSKNTSVFDKNTLKKFNKVSIELERLEEDSRKYCEVINEDYEKIKKEIFDIVAFGATKQLNELKKQLKLKHPNVDFIDQLLLNLKKIEDLSSKKEDFESDLQYDMSNQQILNTLSFLFRKKFDKKNNKNNFDVYFKENISSKGEIISSHDADIFFNNNQEKILFSTYGLAINLNIIGGDKKIPRTLGYLDPATKVIIINSSIKCFGADIDLSQLSELYKNMLDTIVHEYTHGEQVILGDEVMSQVSDPFNMYDPPMDDDFEIPNALIHDRQILNQKNPELKKKLFESRFLGYNKQDSSKDLSGDDIRYSLSVPNVDVESSGRPDVELVLQQRLKNCPGYFEKLKNEYPEEFKNIHLRKNISKLIDLAHKYKEMCESEGQAEIQSKTVLKDADKKGMDKETYKKYLLSPSEIEAHLRGFRAQLKIRKIKLSEFIYEQYNNHDKEELKEIWEEFKKVYRRYGYPEKDLGSDSDLKL
jgi:hypothetical protein